MAGLRAATSSKLQELYFWGVLKTPGELREFASYLETCTRLLTRGFEGVQLEHPDDFGDYGAGIALLSRAAKHHRFETISLGPYHSSQIFDSLTTSSHTSLRRFAVDLRDEATDGPLDLGRFTLLRELSLETPFGDD